MNVSYSSFLVVIWSWIARLLSSPYTSILGFAIDWWGHVWMWELDCEEYWVPKKPVKKADCEEELMLLNCGVGEDSWESLGLQGDLTSPFWRRSALGFLWRNDAKAETPVLWPPHAKSWLIGKDSAAGRDWGQEEKGTTEDEMAGWHHWLDGHESEWTPGVCDGQGGLACCGSWGRRVGHDWVTELNWWGIVNAKWR